MRGPAYFKYIRSSSKGTLTEGVAAPGVRVTIAVESRVPENETREAAAVKLRF